MHVAFWYGRKISQCREKWYHAGIVKRDTRQCVDMCRNRVSGYLTMHFPSVAFEELEKALGVAQRAEEARRQLQVQLEEQVKEVERASEEDRKSLQQELTRVKQEVVTIMKVIN